jgi:hypothetical protein
MAIAVCMVLRVLEKKDLLFYRKEAKDFRVAVAGLGGDARRGDSFVYKSNGRPHLQS